MRSVAVVIPKSNCPYIGIPIPGERPLIIPRERFVRATKGINITSCEVIAGNGHGRELVIQHRTGRVSGRYVFYGVRYDYRLKDAIDSWAERARKKRSESAELPQMPAKFVTAIRKVKRELERMGGDRPPQKHPFNEPISEYERLRAESFEGCRESHARRKAVARIAGLVLTRKLTANQGYDALRKAGFTVRTWSKLRTYEREQLTREGTGELNYWKRAYAFCGVPERPCPYYSLDRYGVTAVDCERHMAYLRRYLTEKRERQVLRDRITELKEQAGAA